MLVVHFITRRPEESKSPEAEAAVSQRAQTCICARRAKKGQESLVAQVPVACGGPLMQGQVLFVGGEVVEVAPEINLLCDASRASASDPQEVQQEGPDEARPFLL